jgi:RecB family exonuclease
LSALTPPLAWAHVSPSQFKTFTRCNLKWWWEKIQGHRSPDTKATLRGTQIHLEIEEALGEGIPPVDPVALAILDLVGHTRQPKDRLEWRFEVQLPGWPVVLKGCVDRVEPELNRITDWKSTSDFKYARSPEELLEDPQAILYAVAAVLFREGFNPDGLRVRFVYGRTRGAAKTLVRECTFTAQHVADRVAELGETAHLMQKTALVRDAALVPANLDACMDYGGCPHRGRCAVLNAPAWALPKTRAPKEGPMNPLLALLQGNNTPKPVEAAPAPAPVAADPVAAFKAKMQAQAAEGRAQAAAEAPDAPPPPAAVDPLTTAATFAVGQRVLLGDSVCQIKRLIGDDAAEMESGVMAYLRELTPAIQGAGTTHDPLRDGLNPSDGVPMDAVVTLPAASRRAVRLPEGCPGEGELCSTLRKDQAISARAYMLTLLKLAEPFGKVGAAAVGKVKATDYKADCLTLAIKLEERGPWDAPGDAPDAPASDATVVDPPVATGEPTPAPAPTQGAGAGPANTSDLLREKLAAGPTPQTDVNNYGTDGPATETKPTQAQKMVAAYDTPDPEPVRLHPPAASVERLQSAGLVNKTPPDERYNRTALAWIGNRPLVLVGGVPTESVPFTHLETVMRPFYDAVEGEAGAPHIGLVKDYQITGYAMAAAKLRLALETGALVLPDVIMASTNMDGAREALGVLSRFCAVVVRP